ncbi:aminotransferase class V-fold PLP-dependent enzyme [Pseudomonadota bacterium]|nr:aminotransferase class V-fold PLP-dependent enzyme [Alphaproteobacteria bacterium]MDC1355948.1 aminotransferase class V-fold PLP-dependent enzyme [Pseudomonadota bacterium]
MIHFSNEILTDIRNRFVHINECPIQGKRVFFENAGGALTLKSVVECSKKYAAIPDNQGRDNPGSHELVKVINNAKDDMRSFMNASEGQFFVGESGTELLFRLIMNACLGTDNDGIVLGSTVEHPATRSACSRWSKISGKKHVLIPHNDDKGLVCAKQYSKYITKDTKVATILHTSPVTGMGMNIKEIAKEIRLVSPDCFIIVDGIQHAAHGQIDIDSYDIDGYVISPYKMFSRHGYGLAWISKRLTHLPHDTLVDGPNETWELGTRDTGAYATLSEVVSYFNWLGSHFTDSKVKRDKFVAAGKAIKNHEKILTDTMIFGNGNIPGLSQIDNVNIIGGLNNPAREGLVSIYIDGIPSQEVVKKLNDQGIRTHLRKADHYSGNILNPLKQDSCIRVSLCHYNSIEEVSQFLLAIKEICN